MSRLNVIKRTLLLGISIALVFYTNSLDAHSIPDSYREAIPGSHIIIDKSYDLQGSQWEGPDNVTLVFKKGGSLNNGAIYGRLTKIKASRSNRKIFNNVTINGTWNVNKIYSNWIDFSAYNDNTIQMKNLFGLCSSEVYNRVYIQSGLYYLEGYDDSAKSPAIIKIPSNTKVYNQATIKVLPHSNKQSFLFYFCGVSDCSWDGGVLIGDVDSHFTNDGEQGFGLALRGAKNIVIKNVECKYFWGDGINLQYYGSQRHNENVLIERVRCVGNRRQGISVEDGINITIRNSSLVNTGIKRGTPPMRGIDIEPCYKEAVISHIKISNCDFENNKGGGVLCCFLKPTDSDILIEKCNDPTGGLWLYDCKFDSHQQGIKVKGYNCSNGKLQLKGILKNTTIRNSNFLNQIGDESSVIAENLTFKNVVIHQKD